MFKYLFGRTLQFILVIFIGITLTFIIPRLGPTDPVESAVSKIMMRGAYTNPKAVAKTKEVLRSAYGLEGGYFQQYVNFWQGLLKGDFGPSLSSFPTPVIDLIKRALPWTMGLMSVAAILSWVIGNILGGLSAYYSETTASTVLQVIAMFLRPIPYYIVAFLIVLVFGYILPIFPIGGAYKPGLQFAINWDFIKSILYYGFLPALSMIAVGMGGWFITMRNLVTNIIEEDYVQYASLANLSDYKLLTQYIMRNAMLPQITGLALQIGLIFNGALIVEIVYDYPGLGLLAYRAIMSGDYSLILGVVSLSIIAVATTTFLVDLIYPLFDPRIKYE